MDCVVNVMSVIKLEYSSFRAVDTWKIYTEGLFSQDVSMSYFISGKLDINESIVFAICDDLYKGYGYTIEK